MEVEVGDVVQKILEVYNREGATLKRMSNMSFSVRGEESGQWLIRVYRDGDGSWIGRSRWGEGVLFKEDGWTEILNMDANRVEHVIHPI